MAIADAVGAAGLANGRIWAAIGSPTYLFHGTCGMKQICVKPNLSASCLEAGIERLGIIDILTNAAHAAYRSHPTVAGIAQLVERQVVVLDVTGSSPVARPRVP
jgi:hypothetical protein